MHNQGDARTLYGLAVGILDQVSLQRTARLAAAIKLLDGLEEGSFPSPRLRDRHLRLMRETTRRPLHHPAQARRIERDLRLAYQALCSSPSTAAVAMGQLLRTTQAPQPARA
ncbi:MAG: hypothetical protein AB7T63_04225 [Planctomycetota bacterium]